MLYTGNYPIDPWHNQPFFYWLPNDYDQTTKSYPVIYFSHGKGEAGTDINKVLGAYLPKRIKGGWEPVANDPKTGEATKFIVIGVQDQYWSPYPVPFNKAAEWIIAGNNVTKKPLRVDRSRFYSTGLSAGGQVSLMMGSWDDTFVGKFAALNPMSMAVMDAQAITNLPKLGKAKTAVWFWSGDQDGATNTSQSYAKTIADNGGNAVVTVFKGGHCCWDNVYNGTVKVKSLDGKVDLNLYEWFLQFTTSSVPPVDPPDPPQEPKKYVLSITFDTKPTVYPVSIKLSDGSTLDIELTEE